MKRKLLCFLPLLYLAPPSGAQLVSLNKDQIKTLMPDWKVGRTADGRPRVSYPPVRDIEGLKEIKGFNAWVKGY